MNHEGRYATRTTVTKGIYVLRVLCGCRKAFVVDEAKS
jgi:hypothetical protein